MRKLKKELVWGVFRKYTVCACNATFHSALEVCLKCDVLLLDSQRRYKPLQQRSQVKGEDAHGALRGVTAFYGGVDSFNRVIHLVLLLQKAGGTDHSYSPTSSIIQSTLNYSPDPGHR